jgi:ABC-type Fe3+ transport system permease subunit
MPTRYKILVLLFAATLIAGTLTLWHSGNDNDAVESFRALFSSSTLYNLKNLLPSDRTSLLYGGLSLFSIVMIFLVLGAARRNNSGRPGK